MALRRRGEPTVAELEAHQTPEDAEDRSDEWGKADVSPPPKPGFGSALRPEGDADRTGAAAGKTVAIPWMARTMRVVWGEEKLTPIPNSYSTVTAGPFESTFVVPEGDDARPYMDAALRELATVAEIERERKVQSFINKLHQAVTRAKERG